ncbi:nitroreductase family protein [Zhongshania guokunii]|uniref:Nitroreductase family protein n=1 Tax=Zhongshania guokunii TaxID=641783 RepID=A0ABV3UAZ7_9GAMM
MSSCNDYPIAPLFRERRSGVTFDPAREVPDVALEHMMEAARWAPSCYGEQPWRFIICRKAFEKDAWQGIFNGLLPLNQQWCENVPCFIVALSRRQFSHNGSDNPWAMYDTGAASLSICLEATQHQIMCHQMAGFNPEAISGHFKLNEDYKLSAIIAVGYPQAEADIPDTLLEREHKPRQRKPLKAIRAYGSSDGII